jgi:hypothetical protein
MDIDSHIGELSDKDLENLHGNAIQLAQSGTASQRAEAERLLPVIGAEVERRQRLRSSAMTEARQQKQGDAAAARRKKARDDAA